jgi:hypothetical protein
LAILLTHGQDQALSQGVIVYERSDGRYHVVSKDETGERHYTTRRSLSDAKNSNQRKSRNGDRGVGQKGRRPRTCPPRRSRPIPIRANNAIR